ncbi:uncharacterized protein LOC119986196 [Tripterygium wilfordii]|uniref:uncharacterized protein LOC119986196 n=1 Tax=Tripterygium wilfordii TaxID=458696 RepID=UPI0018F7FE10|nr:uncharacterized protein LOC119986196 [Tripterygium wilfordii]XP_038686687.1 uncharacterized protein LOC119986196 [Tripterygium wilfordii]
MPVSSVASECAFSVGSRVVDPFRSCLTPRMVEALVCTSDWLRADGFSYYKDPTHLQLELYATLEEVEQEILSTQNLRGMPIGGSTSAAHTYDTFVQGSTT